MTVQTHRRHFRLTWPTTFAILLLFGVAFLVTLSSLNHSSDSLAASTANFRAGYIMSDYVMSNYTSMTESEIQAFLDSKKSCNHAISREASYMHDMGNDTWGYTNSNGKTFTFHVLNGNAVCLADERFGDGVVIGSGDTAAHIIWQTAQEYQINPQVLLVLLEKEQGLLTDDIPNNYQYRGATGYGCPDTAPCNEQFYGFKNQVRKAASLFRTVLNGGWTNYPVGENYIKYNPSAECGGSVVYVENLATSALYRYTPYQPNAGALQAGYGTSYCGAYGNRNFYLYFYDWFGDPTSSDTITEFYRNNGGEAVFGASISEKTCYLNKGGCSQTFANGVITWSKNTGSHFIPNDIYAKWSADGADNNPLGYPTSNLVENPDSSYQQFENGRIYIFPDSSVIEINNTIFNTWANLGGANGILGLPTANLQTDTNGTYQSFQSSIIYSNGSYKIIDPAVSPSEVLPNGTYIFHSQIKDNFVMDISGASVANDANLQLYQANGSNAQKFAVRYYSAGNYYTIMNINSNKYLDLANGSASNYNNIRQYDDTNTCSTRFRITKDNNGYYTFVSTCNNNFVLDVSGGVAANSRNIQIFGSNNSASQKWRAELIELYIIPDTPSVDPATPETPTTDPIVPETPAEPSTPAEEPTPSTPSEPATPAPQGILPNGTYIFHSQIKDNFVMDISGGSTANGANLQLYQANGTPAQKFAVNYFAEGDYYTIKNINSNKYLDLVNGMATHYNNIQQHDDNGTCSTRFRITKDNNGYYTFVSTCNNNFVLDVSGGVAANSRNIQIFGSNNSASQKWRAEVVELYVIPDTPSVDPATPETPIVDPETPAEPSTPAEEPSTDPTPTVDPTPSTPSEPATPAPQGILPNGTYIFHSQIKDNFVMDISGGSTANGANLQLYQANGTPAQKFAVNYFAEGDYYTIKNINSNKYLDLVNGMATHYNNIQQLDDNGTCSSRFRITKDNNGYYTFISTCNNNFVIDVSGGIATNSRNIQIFGSNNSASQKWRAEAI